MQNKIFYLAVIIILISVLCVFFRSIDCSTQKHYKQSAKDTTYAIGNTKQYYKQGNDSVVTKSKSLHNSAILRPSVEDSSYKYFSQDSSYKLSVNLQPAKDGKLIMDYFLDLTLKDLIRIDTIFLTRIDTLKIKQTITERIEPPFYNTFLFGALTTSLIVILLIHFIP